MYLYWREIITLGFITLLFSCSEKKTTKLNKYDRVNLALEQEYRETKNPYTGEVEREKLFEAMKLLKNLQNYRSPSRSIYEDFKWQEIGPSNVGGRTRSFIFDSKDPTGNTVFSGSVSGGIWKCTNFLEEDYSWNPVDDYLSNLAITTIAQSPKNAEHIFAGTGEGWFNVDAVKGAGIWRSLDGGETFSQLPSTNTPDFQFVQKIVVDPSGNIFAACGSGFNTGGVFKSTDNGDTWNKVFTGSMGNLIRPADLEVARDGSLYVSFGIFYSDGVYKSSDAGLTWTKVYQASNEQRIELAVSKSNANVIYALTQSSNMGLNQILKSIDGGETWIKCSSILWADQCGSTTTDICRGQAWYNLSIAVNPKDENHVIVGGIDLFQSKNGGNSWEQLSDWSGCKSSLNKVHADQHGIFFHPNNDGKVSFTNDGGVYLSENMLASKPIISSKNKGYHVTQFYATSVANSDNQKLLSGAQDNGTHIYQNSVNTKVVGGDGAFTHIDKQNNNIQIASYVYNYLYRSLDGGNTFQQVLANNTGNFINPSTYCSNTKTFYSISETGKYFFIEDFDKAIQLKQVTGFSGSFSAIQAHPNNSYELWLGTNEGKLYQVKNATTSPNVRELDLPSGAVGNISCIAINENDPKKIVITFSSYGVKHVYLSSDEGETWQCIDGNLFDVPVRWALFNPYNSNQIFLATELGVWVCDELEAENTLWYSTQSNMPNVRVDMLKINQKTKALVVATHGRGLFTSDILSSNQVDTSVTFCDLKKDQFLGKNLSFFGDQTIKIADTYYQVNVKSGIEKINIDTSLNNGSILVNGKTYTEPGTFFDTLVSSMFCDTIFEIQIQDGLTSVLENEKFLLDIYPNPSNGYFTVRNSGLEELSYRVYQLNGLKIEEGLIRDKTIIDLSNAPKGMYILHVSNGEFQKTLELVKI